MCNQEILAVRGKIMYHRMKNGAACDYIDFNDAEAEFYSGAGWAIAHVEDDQIVKLVYLNQLEYGNEEAEAKVAIDDALESGNCWFGMCSSYQFCDPREMTLDDPTLLAKIMRLSVEED